MDNTKCLNVCPIDISYEVYNSMAAPGMYSMNIIEATKIALKENRCIAQKSFPYAKMVPSTGIPYTICK